MTPRQLVEAHLPLVKSLAYRMRKTTLTGADLEDLESWGCVGLCEAASRYRDGSAATFSTFAFTRIRGAMLDGARKSLGGQTAMGVEFVGGGDLDTLESDGPGVEEEVEVRRRAVALREAVAALPEKERALVEGVDLQGELLEDAGAALGMHKSWASRLRTRGLAALRERLLGRAS